MSAEFKIGDVVRYDDDWKEGEYTIIYIDSDLGLLLLDCGEWADQDECLLVKRAMPEACKPTLYNFMLEDCSFAKQPVLIHRERDVSLEHIKSLLPEEDHKVVDFMVEGGYDDVVVNGCRFRMKQSASSEQKESGV